MKLACAEATKVTTRAISSGRAARPRGMPAPTVRSRLRLGLLKLGGILQERGLANVD